MFDGGGCDENGLVACGCSLAELDGGRMGCPVKVDVECGCGSEIGGIKGRDDRLADESACNNAGLATCGLLSL